MNPFQLAFQADSFQRFVSPLTQIRYWQSVNAASRLAIGRGNLTLAIRGRSW